MIALCLPAGLMGAIACYSAAAGCYADWMNCFSVVQPESWTTRVMFLAAKLVPFVFPTYGLFALAGIGFVLRHGARQLERWLWLGPALFVAALHAACVVFAWTALPSRRLQPTAGFDGIALMLAYLYTGLAHRMLRSLTRAPPR